MWEPTPTVSLLQATVGPLERESVGLCCCVFTLLQIYNMSAFSYWSYIRNSLIDAHSQADIQACHIWRRLCHTLPTSLTVNIWVFLLESSHVFRVKPCFKVFFQNVLVLLLLLSLVFLLESSHVLKSCFFRVFLFCFLVMLLESSCF